MKRRDFLFQLPAGFLLAGACARVPASGRGRLAGEVFVTGVHGVDGAPATYGEVVPDSPSHLVFFTGAGELRTAPVPFDVHSVAQNPRYPNLLLLVPKRGRSIAIFDVARWAIRERAAVAGAGRRFMGHAVWETSGDHFWLTVEDEERRNSVIARWDRTLRPDADRSVSAHAHEVQWSLEGLLLAANSGADGRGAALRWIDPRSGRVERVVDCASDSSRRFVAHFYQLPALGKVFAIGKNDPAKDESLVLAVDVARGRVRALPVPEDAREHFKGESLSINYDERRRLLAVSSVGGAGYISIWDPEKESFVRGVPGTAPREWGDTTGRSSSRRTDAGASGTSPSKGFSRARSKPRASIRRPGSGGPTSTA
jgi:hypothetical protein